jgi:4-amino-4-deoxy-L-arabinose transferase-like glycosyltransferase
MSKYLSHRAAPLLVFFLSVVVALGFQIILPQQFDSVGSDFVTRDLPIAQAILAGQSVIHRDMVFVVGFPVIIAGVIRASQALSIPFENALRILAVLEMGLTTVEIFVLTRFVWSARRAWLAALLWLTYPFALWLTTQNGTELSFIVFFLASLVFFWYAAFVQPDALWAWITAGALVGVSILIRPFAVGVPLVMALGLWILRQNHAIRHTGWVAAIFLVGSLIILAPWEILVFQNTGRWILIDDHGPASVRDGLTFAVDLKDYRRGVAVPEDVMVFMRDAAANQARLDTLGHIVGFVWSYAETEPITILKFFMLKAARAWYGTDSQRFEQITSVVQLGYLLLAIAGTVIAWRQDGKGRVVIVGMLLLIGYFWAITMLALPILRYMVPAMPLVMILLTGIVPAPHRQEV